MNTTKGNAYNGGNERERVSMVKRENVTRKAANDNERDRVSMVKRENVTRKAAKKFQ